MEAVNLIHLQGRAIATIAPREPLRMLLTPRAQTVPLANIALPHQQFAQIARPEVLRRLPVLESAHFVLRENMRQPWDFQSARTAWLVPIVNPVQQFAQTARLEALRRLRVLESAHFVLRENMRQPRDFRFARTVWRAPIVSPALLRAQPVLLEVLRRLAVLARAHFVPLGNMLDLRVYQPAQTVLLAPIVKPAPQRARTVRRELHPPRGPAVVTFAPLAKRIQHQELLLARIVYKENMPQLVDLLNVYFVQRVLLMQVPGSLPVVHVQLEHIQLPCGQAAPIV